MRLVYALFMMFLWAVMVGASEFLSVSTNVQFLALAIMIAGAMAGGDGK